MVLARGNIVHQFYSKISNYSKHEDFKVTDAMVPQARLLAYYVSNDRYPAEIVADSIVIEVNRTCGNEVGDQF